MVFAGVRHHAGAAPSALANIADYLPGLTAGPAL
jgi:hypothetical protein